MIDITKGKWLNFNSSEEYNSWLKSQDNYRHGVLVINEGKFKNPGKYLLIHYYEDRCYTDALLSADEVKELAREKIMEYHEIYKECE